MRRKVFQDFANVFCQRILQLPEGYDLASFVHYGSGAYDLNILTGECSFNGKQIPMLRSCNVFKEWLFEQLEKRLIAPNVIKLASLKINVTVSQLSVKQSSGHEFASAQFSFDCRSEIATDDKSYACAMSGDHLWGFDWYYINSMAALSNWLRGRHNTSLDRSAGSLFFNL
jgi:hypothetical protein